MSVKADRSIKFWKVEVVKRRNWKEGEPLDPSKPKHLCLVRFLAEPNDGTVYTWTPEKWELNLLISVARELVKAEDLNLPLLKNPEPRPDIEELRAFLREVDKIAEMEREKARR
jgi:hypothetical protein